MTLTPESSALFTRLFGDKQTPEQAHRIDDPSQIPAVYRGADPRVSVAGWADLSEKPLYAI